MFILELYLSKIKILLIYDFKNINLLFIIN